MCVHTQSYTYEHETGPFTYSQGVVYMFIHVHDSQVWFSRFTDVYT